MDSLPESEIEAIWQRQKKYIPIEMIKGTTPEEIRNQIKDLMQDASVGKRVDKLGRPLNPQANQKTLVDKGFHVEASQNEKIFEEILGNNIKKITVQGKERFILKKGVTVTTKTGKTFKGGQFLKGKTREKALDDLKRKVEK